MDLNYSVAFANYTIGPNAYKAFADVCERLGKKFVLIGGKTALEKGKGKLDAVLAESDFQMLDCIIYGTECTYKRIDELAGMNAVKEADFIVGMGGGKALDTAKGVAYQCGVPIVTMPTIAATCAAATALSVVYREDSTFESFYFFEKPAVHCFIDSEIIANAPAKYLRAGIGDTLGKHFECHLSARGDKLDHNSALGREISNMCYEPVVEHGKQALADCEKNEVTYALQQIILANIISTGMVSVLVNDDYNCAIAHSVFYGLAILPGFEEENLHGDVVAYGVLVQLAIDKQYEVMESLYGFLREIGIPTMLADMKVENDRAVLNPVLTETVIGPDMEHLPYRVSEEMVYEGIQRVEELNKKKGRK